MPCIGYRRACIGMIRQLPTLRTNSVPIALTTTLGMQTSHSGTGWPMCVFGDPAAAGQDLAAVKRPSRAVSAGEEAFQRTTRPARGTQLRSISALATTEIRRSGCAKFARA